MFPRLRFLLLFSLILGNFLGNSATSRHHGHSHSLAGSNYDLSLFENQIEQFQVDRSKKSSLSSQAETADPARCQSFETDLHVSKEERSPSGELIRVCDGVIKVTKCEGTCLSRLRPLISSPSGFLKECKCCRESSMIQKSIQLELCFDADGIRLPGQTMEISLSQPSDCQCTKCA